MGFSFTILVFMRGLAVIFMQTFLVDTLVTKTLPSRRLVLYGICLLFSFPLYNMDFTIQLSYP